MKVLAISGWKGSGKDTIAAYLIEKYGFVRTAFADPLKDMTAAEYGVERSWMDDPKYKEAPLLHLPVNPQDGFSRMLTDFMVKEFKSPSLEEKQVYWTPRALCILKGSTNRSVDSSFWVKRAISVIKSGEKSLNVITDLRYNSEAKQLKEAFGSDVVFLRIKRFDKSPSSDPSERDLDNFEFDLYVDNTGSLDKAYGQVDGIVSGL
jgi:hypothetical protein